MNEIKKGSKVVGKTFTIGNKKVYFTHRNGDIYFGRDAQGDVKTFKKIGGELKRW